MKHLFFLLALTVPVVVQAHPAHINFAPSETAVVKISCYRGPITQVIWDQPNPEFLSSLQNLGYTRVMATQVGQSICRDPDLVGNIEGMKAALLQIVKETPPTLKMVRVR